MLVIYFLLSLYILYHIIIYYYYFIFTPGNEIKARDVPVFSVAVFVEKVPVTRLDRSAIKVVNLLNNLNQPESCSVNCNVYSEVAQE